MGKAVVPKNILRRIKIMDVNNTCFGSGEDMRRQLARRLSHQHLENLYTRSREEPRNRVTVSASVCVVSSPVLRPAVNHGSTTFRPKVLTLTLVEKKNRDRAN